MALQHCFYLVWMVLMLTVQFQYCVMGNLVIQDVRLRWRGRIGPVDVQMNGSWYAVCAKNWNDDDSKAACLELGYSMGQKVNWNIGRGGLPFLRWKFNCNGDDTILSKCGTDSVSCPNNHRTAQANCNGKIPPTTSMPATTKKTMEPATQKKTMTKLTMLSMTDAQNTGKMLSLTNWTQQYKTTVVPATTKKTMAKPSMSPMTDAPNTGNNAKGTTSTTTGQKGQSPRAQKQSQFPIVTVAAAVGTILGILLLLAVLLCCYCRRRARNQDNMTSKLKENTNQVGMGELGKEQQDDSENTYNTIQDPAVIPTAPPSEHDENYSTIPDLQSSPTGGRVDERAPAPPPNQTDIYYSTVRDNGTASTADKTGTPVTAKTTQEPEYAVVKKASKRKENKSKESEKGTAALGPEYAVVNKVPKTGGKGENQYGTVDNVIYEPY